MPVVETYIRLAICDRCNDVQSLSFGFLNRSCTVCLVGHYRNEMPMNHSIGCCPECHAFADVGMECLVCTETQMMDPSDTMDGQDFEVFDADLIHLDLMTNPSSFAMLQIFYCKE